MFTPRLCFSLVAAALCLVALRVPGIAQTSSPQAPPTFRSTVDLLTIETSVRDNGGLPVPDLQASDFTVTIDGKPRKVMSAVFFKADPAAGNRLSGGAAPTPQYVSNDRGQPGRVVVFALDAQTIRAGQERALFDTASRMLAGLAPADAVGLLELPGPAIDVTRDHSAVADALKRFRGRAPAEAEEEVGRSHLTPPAGVIAMPIQEVRARANTQQLLLDLAKLLRGMTVVRAPRSVILISGGLAFGPELMTPYKELQRAAAESRTVLYTVLLEDVGYEVARGETRPDVVKNPAKAEGLATIGSMTGGMFFHGSGTAAGVFDRIQSEVSSFYQLAIESSPADADGKEHDVKVRVSRAGVDVRAPSHVAVSKPSRAALRDPLLAALQQPTDVPDVPLSITTYSTHAPGGAIRLLVSAEIGAANGAAPAEWGFAISQKGKGVITRRGKIPAGSPPPRVISTTVEVPPGEYSLRVAAVDTQDRIGVLEIPVIAGYQTAAGTRLSDLIVGAVTGGKLEPRRRIAQSEEIIALVEALGESGTGLGGTLELIPGGGARNIFRIPFSVRRPSSAGAPSTVEASAALDAVPPGRYTASAVLELGGQALMRISRMIEITGVPPGTTQQAIAAAPVAEPRPASPPPPDPAAAAAAPPDEIMRRVGAYVEQYGGQASLLVAVEHYSQEVTQLAVARGSGVSEGVSQERRLVSEFALVPNASANGGWLGFRDVVEMNGRPVADRRDRLQALFQSGAPDLEQARRIADEGARYNIGPVSRNFNVPTATLFFFEVANLPRFTFRRKDRERIAGVDTVAIDFAEERAPTLTMTASGKDVAASGTLWVNPVDGAVVRTRLEFRGFDNAVSRAVIEVTYRKDAALAMWVPSRMTERYSGGSGETATTVATYKDFKRFQTSVKIK